MAKKNINSTAKFSKVSPTKGSPNTPKGVMPADKLKRFGIKPEYNTPNSMDLKGLRQTEEQRRWTKKMIELERAHRIMFNVAPKERRLAGSLKDAIRYFSVPLVLESGVKASSRREQSNQNISDEGEVLGADPTKVVLKV